jgi:hypothetical protein
MHLCYGSSHQVGLHLPITLRKLLFIAIHLAVFPEGLTWTNPSWLSSLILCLLAGCSEAELPVTQFSKPWGLTEGNCHFNVAHC